METPGRTDLGHSRRAILLLVALVALSVCSRTGSASALTPAQVSGATSEIQSAFTAAYQAERAGGNVSSLVSKLNQAIQLVQQAEAENATSPSQSARDLANATLIAQGVAAAAGPLGQQGASSRQAQLSASAGSAAVIVVAAGLIYAFGEKVLRRAWLWLYGSYLVRRIG